MPNELDFVPHCDYELCDLGSAEYTCPACEKSIVDYGDLWWEHLDDSELWKRGTVTTKCPECGAALVVKRNENEYRWEIEVAK